MSLPSKEQIKVFLELPIFKAAEVCFKLMESLRDQNIESKRKEGIKNPNCDNDLKLISDIFSADYMKLSQEAKDLFYHYHKERVFSTVQINKITPGNVETFTIVTASGFVCVIRKPIGRILGNVMSKIGPFSKNQDFYGAGEIIYQECMIYCEDEIKNDDDEKFAVKMATLGATKMIESNIKKN